MHLQFNKYSMVWLLQKNLDKVWLQRNENAPWYKISTACEHGLETRFWLTKFELWIGNFWTTKVFIMGGRWILNDLQYWNLRFYINLCRINPPGPDLYDTKTLAFDIQKTLSLWKRRHWVGFIYTCWYSLSSTSSILE